MRQFLLIDADDTLWENNIYFEEAFERFYSFLSHSSMTPAQVRAALDEIEMIRIKTHGYGARNFAHNCADCYQRLVERDIASGDVEHIISFADDILNQPIELLPDVEATLAQLAARHDLTLFTKGHGEEQQAKIDRSGIGHYFGHTAIVREKDTQAYATMVADRALPRESTWMIGNSPKSDINPALAAGLNAVYVPHDRTWHLEKMDLASGLGKLVVVERFSDLLNIF